MFSIRKLVAATAASAAAFTGLAGFATAAHADTVSDESVFLTKLNDLRASRGLRPLASNSSLVGVGRDWSAHMAADGAISHNPALASQAPSTWQRLGENVGTASVGDNDGLFTAFVNSAAHYANMVDSSFDSVGVGVVYSANNTLFVTYDFMTTAGAPAASLASASAAAPAPARVTCRKVGRRTVCKSARARRTTTARRRHR